MRIITLTQPKYKVFRSDVSTPIRGVPNAIGSSVEAESLSLKVRSTIYKISYDLSYDYLKIFVRSTYDSDLKRAKISLRNILS